MTRLVFHALLLAGSAAAPAEAQDNIQSAPVQTAPRVETFTLPQATPTPVPLPAATPTPSASPTTTPVAPPPVIRTRPTPAVTPAPVATPTPTPRATPTVASAPEAIPSSTPAPAPAPSPMAQPTPTTTASPPVVAVTETPAGPPWLAIGGVLLALLAIATAILLRRRQRTHRAERHEDASPMPAPSPAPVSPPRATPRPAAPAPEAAGRGLVTTLRPKEMWTRGPDGFLAFDLVVTNRGAEAADGVRVTVALSSAGPGIAEEIAGWQAGADFTATPEPFALASGESYVLGGELRLPGDLMHVNEVADRAMIVPVAMIAMRWRGGLAIRTAGDAYLIGTGDAGAAKLGPIWVDRPGQRFTTLDARRFEPKM